MERHQNVSRENIRLRNQVCIMIFGPLDKFSGPTSMYAFHLEISLVKTTALAWEFFAQVAHTFYYAQAFSALCRGVFPRSLRGPRWCYCGRDADKNLPCWVRRGCGTVRTATAPHCGRIASWWKSLIVTFWWLDLVRGAMVLQWQVRT